MAYTLKLATPTCQLTKKGHRDHTCFWIRIMRFINVLFYLLWGLIVLLPFNAFLATISSFNHLIKTSFYQHIYPILTMYFLIFGCLFGTFIGYTIRRKNLLTIILVAHISCFGLVIVACSDRAVIPPLQRLTLMCAIMAVSACTGGMLQSIMYGRFNNETKKNMALTKVTPIQLYMVGINLCGIIIPLIVIAIQSFGNNKTNTHQNEILAVFGFSFFCALLTLPNTIRRQRNHSTDEDSDDESETVDFADTTNGPRMDEEVDFSNGFRSFSHQFDSMIEMVTSTATTAGTDAAATATLNTANQDKDDIYPNRDYQVPHPPPKVLRILLDNIKLMVSILITSIAISITYGQISPIGKFNHVINDYINSTTPAVSPLLVQDGPILLLSLNCSIILGTLVPVGYIIHRLLESHLVVLATLRLVIVLLCAFYMPFKWWQIIILLIFIGLTNGHLFTLIYTLPMFHKKANGVLLTKMLCIAILVGFLMGHVITTLGTRSTG